jgi:hypothetical protein
MKDASQEQAPLDPVRQLVRDRARAVGLTLADASRHLERNESYIHQFLFRKSPRRLPEEVRGPLALLLGVPEGSLVSGPLPPAPNPEVRLGTVAMPTQDIPVFTEADTIEPALASEWIKRPPLLGGTGPLFGLWIGEHHSPRLRSGDLAIVRMNQPARFGDLIVVLSGKQVVAAGELVELTPVSVKLIGRQSEIAELTPSDRRVLKVGCVVLA